MPAHHGLTHPKAKALLEGRSIADFEAVDVPLDALAREFALVTHDFSIQAQLGALHVVLTGHWPQQPAALPGPDGQP